MAIINLSAEQAGNSALISDFPSLCYKLLFDFFNVDIERRPEKTASHAWCEWNKS